MRMAEPTQQMSEPTRHQQLVDLEKAKTLLRRWAEANPLIGELRIFGSYAKSTVSPDSDLDVAVRVVHKLPGDTTVWVTALFECPRWAEELSRLLGVKVDVQDIDCDFMIISGHKMMAPTGIGVLYVKENILKEMQPFLMGGDMIKEVSLEGASWNDLPWKFEAGTPDIAGAIGLNAAVNYLMRIGMDNVRKHEIEITEYALKKLSTIKGIKIYGSKNAGERAGVISFNIDNVHSHDVASIVDGHGIAIRSGHNCAQPLMKRLGVSSVARASFYVYNTKEDVDRLIDALNDVRKVFKL